MFSRLSRVGIPLLACALALGSSCTARQRVAHPKFENGGLLATSRPLSAEGLTALGGLYRADPAPSRFGPNVALHPTRNTLSIFGDKSAGYAILKAGCLDDGRLVLEGHWRYPVETDSGLVRLFVGPPTFAKALCDGTPLKAGSPSFEGTTGLSNEVPSEALALTFEQPLVDLRGRFFVVGHRGACRTIDDCGASENSAASIRMAPSFGANVAEMDVQVSADGVPFLYHDDVFGPRLARGAFCHGTVGAFTFAHIREICTLRYGEPVPSLDEALAAALETEELDALWLDMKTPEAIAPTAAVVRTYLALAKARNRPLRIVLGLATPELLEAYERDVPKRDVGCLAELDVADVRRLDCEVWGPRWTQGPMSADVATMQAEGRAVAFWTIDEPEYIDVFLDKARPNAIVTNRHGLVFLHAQRRGESLRTLRAIGGDR